MPSRRLLHFTQDQFCHLFLFTLILMSLGVVINSVLISERIRYRINLLWLLKGTIRCCRLTEKPTVTHAFQICPIARFWRRSLIVTLTYDWGNLSDHSFARGFAFVTRNAVIKVTIVSEIGPLFVLDFFINTCYLPLVVCGFARNCLQVLLKLRLVYYVSCRIYVISSS